MSKIAITDYFDKPGEEEVSILGNLVGTDVGEDTEVLLVWHETIDKPYIDKLPNLRGIQRYGVGYDTLDLDYIKSKGIVCCNNPDYGVDEVSDTAVAMILNIARRISLYNFSAKKYNKTWQENVNLKIKRNNKTVIGVIGAGRIGGSVLLKCNLLKLKTVFYDPYKERGYEKMINSHRVDTLDELLKVADIISIHTPLNLETKNYINEDFIRRMKKGSSIVNTARGGLIENLDYLYNNLEKDQLGSIALDVLPEEPPLTGKLIDAWKNNNHPLQGRIIINPHTSYYSQQSYKEIKLKAAMNALRIFKNETPFNLL